MRILRRARGCPPDAVPPSVPCAGYSVAVGDFNGDGIDGRIGSNCLSSFFKHGGLSVEQVQPGTSFDTVSWNVLEARAALGHGQELAASDVLRPRLRQWSLCWGWGAQCPPRPPPHPPTRYSQTSLLERLPSRTVQFSTEKNVSVVDQNCSFRPDSSFLLVPQRDSQLLAGTRPRRGGFRGRRLAPL